MEVLREENMKLQKELNILKGQIGKGSTLTRRTEAGTQTPDFVLDSPPRKEDKRKGKNKGKDTPVRKRRLPRNNSQIKEIEKEK